MPVRALRDFVELEEQVGRAWHRLVRDPGSYPRFPEAGVTLRALGPMLGVFFRAVGGDPAVPVVAASLRTSSHRLTWRQRLAMPDERVPVAVYDPEALRLPERIDLFPQTSLNRDLYFWLAAFLAEAGCRWEAAPADDPLIADLVHLRNATAASARACRRYPGLRASYARLCRALRPLRAGRRLPPLEAAVEEVAVCLLGGPPPSSPLAAGLMEAVTVRGAPFPVCPAGRRYRPLLPIPVWGDVNPGRLGGAPSPADPIGDHRGACARDEGRRHAARRQRHDQTERDDPLILNRFEKIIAWAEMVNVNRATDDEDEDAARRAADDLDQLTLGRNARRPATRLRLDLDVSPSTADACPLAGECRYPEWDYRNGAYRFDHCRVNLSVAGEGDGEAWQPDEAGRRRIRHVRRQFEALRPGRVLERRQLDGFDLDTDAAVRARCELVATGTGSEQIFEAHRNLARDYSVGILTDVSLSTDGWVDNRRVLDVEKEALTVLAHGLAGCGDEFAITTFTSRSRDDVRIETVKAFDEPVAGPVLRRIAGLRPGAYTRLGAAVRHGARSMSTRGGRHRLLLLLTDGKPNDIDHYEGRYGLEDTRMAIREARRSGIAVFGITIDKTARDYVPYLFGRGGYAIVGHVSRLPQALPALYRHLTR